MAVNGVRYDHEGLRMSWGGASPTSLRTVTYKCKKEKEVVTDQRGLPQGTVRKAFTGDFDCELSRSDYDAFAETVAEIGVLGAEGIEVTLVYGHYGGDAQTDELVVVINDCEFSSDQDAEAMVKLSGALTAVPKINGREIYVAPDGA